MTRRWNLALRLAAMLGAVTVAAGCADEGKPGPRTAGDAAGGLSEEQRVNLRRYRSLRKLAEQLLERRNYSIALDKVNRALLLAGQVYGARHPLLAETIALRGRIYLASGQHALAADSFLAELKQWKRALDPGDNIVVARCLHRIGEAYLLGGDEAQARTYLEKAVAMKRATLGSSARRLGKHYVLRETGPRAPGLARSLHRLGQAYWKLKLSDEAVKALAEAARLGRKHLPAQDPALVQWLIDLAETYEALQRFNLATGVYHEIVQKLRKVGAPGEAALARALKSLADMSLRTGKHAAAERHYKEARKLVAGSTRVRDKELFQAELDSRLAILYMKTKRTAEAKILHQQALAVFRKNLKGNASSVVRCLVQLAKIHRQQGKLDVATKTIREALNVIRQHQGHQTYSYARALVELGEVYVAQKANEQAARIIGRAFEIVVKLHGAKHPRTQRVRARLITLYTALGWKDKLKELER